ncbi:hypothetical protein [Atopobacter phocae]|uniref:hypothetical protein n=1 Tax=Atopobacter phocae TaxID=136492 RepID=UPI0004724EB0|nr:hypothetical protein [Atopobacter phocae]
MYKTFQLSNIYLKRTVLFISKMCGICMLIALILGIATYFNQKELAIEYMQSINVQDYIRVMLIALYSVVVFTFIVLPGGFASYMYDTLIRFSHKRLSYFIQIQIIILLYAFILYLLPILFDYINSTFLSSVNIMLYDHVKYDASFSQFVENVRFLLLVNVVGHIYYRWGIKGIITGFVVMSILYIGWDFMIKSYFPFHQLFIQIENLLEHFSWLLGCITLGILECLNYWLVMTTELE